MPDEIEEESPHNPANSQTENSLSEITPDDVEPVNTNPDRQCLMLAAIVNRHL